jgi:hypothetical protein
MAGSLTIDTLKAGSGVFASQNAMTGIPKAWVNWTGSNGTVNASFNVSSVTRNATGYYTINLTTSMPSSTYSATASTCTNAASSVQIASVFWSQPANAYIAPRAGAYEVSTTQYTGGAVDSVYVFSAAYSS